MANSLEEGKNRSINWYCMLPMVGKSIRGGMCYIIYWYVKASNKYINDFDKKKEPSSHLMYWNVNNLYWWAISLVVSVKKLSVNGFKWVEEASQFNEDFIKIYNEDSDGGCFLEVDV